MVNLHCFSTTFPHFLHILPSSLLAFKLEIFKRMRQLSTIIHSIITLLMVAGKGITIITILISYYSSLSKSI